MNNEPMYFCERTNDAPMEQPTLAASNWMLIHGLRWGIGATGLMLVMNDSVMTKKHIDSYVIVVKNDTIQSIAAECRTKGLI